MRVKRIKIKRVMGIEEFELVPSQRGLTKVVGGNDAGKTSLLEALRSIFQGGHDATLLRRGAKEGEVVLVLDDGTEVQKRITANGSDLKLKKPDVGRIGSPKTFLDSLVTGSSFDPALFLDAGPRDRLDMLLRAVPMELPEAKLREVIDAVEAPADQAWWDVMKGKHPLIQIDSLDRSIFDERTGISRAAREKRATADELRGKLPPDQDLDRDWDAEEAQAQKDLEQALARLRDEQGRVQSAYELALSEAKGTAETQATTGRNRQRERQAELKSRVAAVQAEGLRRVAEVNAWLKGETQKLESEISSEAKTLEIVLADIGRSRADALSVAGQLRDEALKQVGGALQPVVDEGRRKLEQVREQARGAAKMRGAREIAVKVAGEAESLEAKAELLTQGRQRLQELKEALLKDLPIPGLEVKDGEILLEGVPFDRLSESRRVELSIEVARRSCRGLPLIVMDGIERLDPQRLKLFEERLAGQDIQVIVTRVEEGPLRNGKE